MPNEYPKSRRDPAEGSHDAPDSERRSQESNVTDKHDSAAERIEKGKDKDPNPLAPPVNTQAES